MINTPKRSVIFILLIIFLLYFGMSAFSQNEVEQNSCFRCHKTVFEKGIYALYKHPPFEQGKCWVCHLKQLERAPFVEREAVRVKTAEPMTLSSSEYLGEHTIFLPRLVPKAVYDISVLLRDMSGDTLKKELKDVTPANVQEIKTDDGKPPVISGIRIGAIKKSIFLETTITWETDTPSTSHIKYGNSEQYGKSTTEDTTLVKHHRVTLYELEVGKEYHFRAVSRDMFGNEGVSDDRHFNTATLSQIAEVEKRGKREKGKAKLAATRVDVFQLRSVHSVLGLHVVATRPVNVTVEYVKVEYPPVKNEPRIEQTPVVGKQRCPDLIVGEELAIDACYRCHPPEKLGLSHPVGVVQKQTTKVPDDLPMLKGGIITCVTCHDAHGASRRYLVRREITGNICIFCHEGY